MGKAKKVFVAIMTIAALCFSLPAKAGENEKRVVELELTFGLGGAIGLIGSENAYPNEVTTKLLTGVIGLRVGFPQFSWMRLETTAIPGGGIGTNLICDFVHVGRVKVHLIDPGILINTREDSKVSVSRVDRAFDITIGAGLDVRMADNFAIGLDWRTFIPNPNEVTPIYNNFARPVYSEAVRGGQLWAKISLIW